MPAPRTLRGGCQCGRNMYIIQPPPDAREAAMLLFDPAPLHRASLGSPLPSYLRVPLAWYHSTTLPFFPDETQAMIHRSYEHLAPRGGPATSSTGTRRHFCGFCGTPLSFWSESPRSEADYIRLALGSLSPQDLDELDEWAGTEDVEDVDDEGEEAEAEAEAAEDDDNVAAPSESLKRAKPGDGPLDRIPSSTGIPWFDSFVEGSRLSRHLLKQQMRQQTQKHRQTGGAAHMRRHEAGSAQSADGTVQVEWEVLEWTEGDDDEEGGAGGSSHTATGARARSSPMSPVKRARLGEDESEVRVSRGKPSGDMDVE